MSVDPASAGGLSQIGSTLLNKLIPGQQGATPPSPGIGQQGGPGMQVPNLQGAPPKPPLPQPVPMPPAAQPQQPNSMLAVPPPGAAPSPPQRSASPGADPQTLALLQIMKMMGVS